MQNITPWQNSSTDGLMRAPQQLSMEELEAIGEKHVRQQNKQTKNILASVRLVMACGWMSG